jgi:hypothetical protein
MKFWPRRPDAVDEEIRGHIEMAVRDRMERGESRDQAEAAARREFGDVVVVKEVTRDMDGRVWVTRLGQDLRYAGLRAAGRAQPRVLDARDGRRPSSDRTNSHAGLAPG